MSRLDEIQEYTSWTIDNGIVPRLNDSDLGWLIQQAESNKHLLEQIDVTQHRNERLQKDYEFWKEVAITRRVQIIELNRIKNDAVKRAEKSEQTNQRIYRHLLNLEENLYKCYDKKDGINKI
jgi:hypothetical protein